MLTQAAGFAILAAFSPTALLVGAVFLGGANPRRTFLVYLAGAICMTALMAIIVYVALRAGHLYKPQERQARYGLRLGLGLLLLVLSGYVLRRGHRRRRGTSAGKPARQGQGMVARMTARPSPKTAFLAGILIYSPSVTFIAAVQAVATARPSVVDAVIALIVVTAITVACVWLPLVLYLLAPDRTTHELGRFNAWLHRHAHEILMAVMVVAGLALTINGITGLA